MVGFKTQALYKFMMTFRNVKQRFNFLSWKCMHTYEHTYTHTQYIHTYNLTCTYTHTQMHMSKSFWDIQALVMINLTWDTGYFRHYHLVLGRTISRLNLCLTMLSWFVGHTCKNKHTDNKSTHNHDAHTHTHT